MCGIFGAVVGDRSPLAGQRHRLDHVKRLFELSASRGKEAAGLAVASERELVVYKQPMPAPEFIRTSRFDEVLGGRLSAFIGHSRLVTDGAREVNGNNQPVISSGIVGIHNGIVVNHARLWAAHQGLERHHDIDSEVIFALLRAHLKAGRDLPQAVAATFGEIEGAASIACLFEDRDVLLLATNNGSLYYRVDRDEDTFVFASEAYILRQFIERGRLNGALAGDRSIAVKAGEGVLVDLASLTVRPFAFAAPPPVVETARAAPREVIDRSPETVAAPHVRRGDHVDLDAIAARFPYRPTTSSLRRCSRCILPETMPFIDFDAAGVCNYCRKHRPIALHGRAALEALVAPHRRSDGGPDCVVAVSGGRDSMYGLHYVKKVLGLNPLAYTYDWGMVTDLARRNVSRICGKLGVEHILVSADIQRKRANIRKNVDAWLDRPSLGAVPLFMAGDKAYFHHLTRVCEQNGARLAFLCENLLERSDFKVGFAGVRPEVVDDDHTYTLGVKSKARLIGFFLREFASNRGYLNRSLADSAMAFGFFYLKKRRDHNLFHYIPWVEEELVATIKGEYDFELAPDTTATWRIGDGTAAFYNYIYHSIAGFSENDTFRSNQIRNGAIDRARALALVEEENRPRFESIQWYLDTIGIERSLARVLEIIQSAPKIYQETSP